MIKVDKSVKPIHYSKRVDCNLVIGKKYYVSFGNNKVKECKLIEIYKQGDIQKVSVEMNDGVNTLYANEIGETPEQAVINTVTS